MSTKQSPQDTLTKLRAGALIGSTRLDLACELTTFPEEIFDLADSLEVLNLTGNQLSTLPSTLTKLTKLKIIFCSENQFTHVPEVLGEFEHLSMVGFKSNKINHLPKESLAKNLRWLILTDNVLPNIPASIGDCTAMQKLMLAGNQLSELPESLMACQQLELLRISANQFQFLPHWLHSMPRLAWLAIAGNPMTQPQEQHALSKNQLPSMDWQHLTLGNVLGEGASGKIYQASYLAPKDHVDSHTLDKNAEEKVAVKLFKGEVTSDGLPQSEMAAWVHAGSHPNLTEVRGILSGHPAQKQGLIMPCLDPAFKALAHPPSLASCTRDVYNAQHTFRCDTILNIAISIADATAHLHHQGILHGDLYAHNILHQPNHVLLSDFGGAAFLPQEDAKTSKKLQQLEVRAFACLLEELLKLCEKAEQSHPTFNALLQLQQVCNNPVVEERPVFQEILTHLLNLKK